MAKGTTKSAEKSATNSRVAMTAGKAFIRAERERNKRRVPLSKIPAEAREMFRCERWSCSLSRFACSLRWTAASDTTRGDASNPSPSGEFWRCRGCELGRDNNKLVCLSRKRASGDQAIAAEEQS